MAIYVQDCFIFQQGSADPPHSCPHPIPALPPLSNKASFLLSTSVNSLVRLANVAKHDPRLSQDFSSLNYCRSPS